MPFSTNRMKKDIHAKNYRPVIFFDTSSGKKFLISSTIETKETGKWEDGKTYPQHSVEISSASHPFYTGQEKVLDTAGRVEKFKIRRAAATKSLTKKKNKASIAKSK
jgi:large subunit ribosomal protein L31